MKGSTLAKVVLAASNGMPLDGIGRMCGSKEAAKDILQKYGLWTEYHYLRERLVRKRGEYLQTLKKKKAPCYICLFRTRGDCPLLVPTIDHVVPKWNFGLDHAGNWEMAHAFCNSTKGSTPFTEDLQMECRLMIGYLAHYIYKVRL